MKEFKFWAHCVLAVITAIISARCFVTTGETSTQDLLLSIGSVVSFIIAFANAYACYLFIERGGLE